MSNELYELKKEELKKDWKSTAYQYGISLIVFELISGTVLLFSKKILWFEQFLLLFHMLLGFLLIVSIVAFYFRLKLYLKIWNGHKRSALLGWSTLFCFGISFFTGAILFFTGVTGLSSLRLLHLISSFIFTVFFFSFIALVIFSLSPKSNERQQKAFFKMLRLITLRVVLFFSLIWGASIIWAKNYSAPKLTVTVKNYRMPFKNNPFFPSSVKTDNGTFYKKEVFSNSQSCGVSGCHEGIKRQWEDSTHFRTPNFFVQAVEREMLRANKNGFFDLKKLEHIKKINDQFPAREVFRKCAACHAPAALVSGNIGNHTPPSHDEQFEGVSCSTCHSLETTGFSGGGDYTLKPQSQYLFYYSNNPFAQYLHNALIKNKPDLHKEAYTKTFYRESAACVGCHERLHFKSWKESAYNNEQEPGLSKHCQSCHMPDVHEEDEVSARITGTVKDHRFLSGGLTIAKLYHREKQFNKTKAFLQDKKIDVSIIRPLLAKPGGVFSFVVRNANLGVGHNFPAGPESDIVEAWVYIKVTDSNGIVLFEEGKLGSDNILDKTKCFVYYSHPNDSNGKKLEFDRHRSWIFVSDEHQLIAPRMFHDVPFQLKIPASAKGKIKIEASLNYRKPNQEFANWALGQTNFKVPHVSMDHDEQFVELSSDQERLSKALEQYAQVLQIQSLPGGIRKMHVFPKNEKQLDVESKIILHHVRELAKKGKINEALKNLQAIGSEVKKTRFYKETMEQVKRPNQVDNK